ncbi:glycolipid transfer protein B [Wyeomyia smithii]|uniref:glycolipid transfer protein B n=1 Tax=Wyeomyia smithii TaxID=174621 RepID=UPI002467E56A|nr:glycolipid transfer protein B [Wyeomyia smithii]XP_055524362.1 glycolipid transfer protein B [Wyeomyia smithii]
MADIEPRIDFIKLKCFPEIDYQNKNSQIPTVTFLESAGEVIDGIESFGRLFVPIVRDMRGNVKRLETKYSENKEAFYYLEDLILFDKNGKANSFDTVTDALLWLKRALEMIEMFFRNMLDDTSCSDNVKHHLKKAYDEALLPYHGFLAQKGFQILNHYVPSRTTLLGSAKTNQQNMDALKKFLFTFRANINYLNNFFDVHDFNKTYKV